MDMDDMTSKIKHGSMKNEATLYLHAEIESSSQSLWLLSGRMRVSVSVAA